MKNRIIAASALAGLLTIAVSLGAAEDDGEATLAKQMKGIGKAMHGYKDAISARDGEKVAKDAKMMAELFEKTVPFWEGRKVEDAAKWSKESAASAKEMSEAAKSGNWALVDASLRGVGKNCKACHEAHREKVDDQHFKIK